MLCPASSDNTLGPQYCNQFDFTLLFEQTTFQIAPCALLLLTLPLRVLQLRRWRVKTARGIARTIKSIAIALLATAQLAQLIAWCRLPKLTTKASIPATALSFTTSLALLFLSNVEHVRSVQPSSIISIYMLFSFLLDLPQARTLWLRSESHVLPIVFSVSMTLKLTVLYLEARSKKRSLLWPYCLDAPEVLVGIYDQIMLWWLSPLFLKGYAGIISFDSLMTIDPALCSRSNEDMFERQWDGRGSSATGRRLIRAIFASVHQTILGVVFARLFLGSFKLLQPLLIQRVTSWLSSTESDLSTGQGLIGSTVVLYFGLAVVNVIYKRQVDRLMTKIRGILISAGHKKSLRLWSDQLCDGAALSLLSTDSNRVSTSIPVITELLAAPLEVIGAMILLERQIGVLCVVPFLLSITITGLSFASSHQAIPFQKRWLTAVQDRIAYTAAVLGSSKSFKMLGLTPFLIDQIQGLRKSELSESASYRRFVTVRNTFGWMVDDLGPATTLTVFALVNGSQAIDPSLAFTTLSLVNLLATPIHDSILAIPEAINAHISLDRIEKFLLRDDCQSYTSSIPSSSERTNDLALGALEVFDMSTTHPTTQPLVRLESATICAGSTRSIILHSVCLEVFPHTLICIVGPVGCGKSTLLRTIIGDVRPTSGERIVNMAVEEFAFCAQDTWLPRGTVRNCILGTAGFEEERYQTVVQACALSNDIESFSSGDGTLIGSNGCSLSGGQKQRLALARALYSRKKIVVLDDITSGIDTKSSAKIFGNLRHFCDTMGLAVVLATHALHHLSYADHVVVLDNNGAVVEQGTVSTLSSLHTYEGSTDDTQRISQHDKPQGEVEVPRFTEPVVNHESDRDTQKELARRTGDISVYRHYAASIGWKLGSVVILSAVAFAFGRKFPELWVRWWCEDAASGQPKHSLGVWTGVYFLLALTSITSIFLHLWSFLVWTIPKSSAKLHKQLLDSVMNAPYSFFVKIDPGTTLNRFANDMSLIELNLAGGIVQTLLGIGICTGAAILIVAGADYAGTIIPLVVAVLYILQKFYLRTSRQLRLMDLEAQSPLFAHFQQTLAGVTTIRAFRWQDDCHQQCLDLLDRSQRPYYLLLCVQRWLNLVLDLVTAGMATVVVILAITMRQTASASSVGVSLLNILSFNTQLSTLIVAWTALEMSLGAVARCKSFGETTPSEHLPGESSEPTADWPSKGHLKLSGLSAAYVEGRPVLKDVSIDIPQGAKVGICGRSGSGKSSLILTLFRMLDPTAGTIEVDGVDLATLSRSVVRDRFTALPQDPISLPGSVRTNLDPFHSSSQEDLSSALDTVGLLHLVLDRGGLDGTMNDLALSHGEMQLFAVARALLRPSKLLIVDEMTSSVDQDTEHRMMAIIRREFSQSTVIAVAHRLQPIVDFDMLIVMNNGGVVQCGPPVELMQNQGPFKEMWERAIL